LLLTLGGQNVAKYSRKLGQFKGLSDKVLNSQPGGGDGLLTIGARENNFHVGPSALDLFKDLPAGFPGQREIQ
jgi:hypothetical protein